MCYRVVAVFTDRPLKGNALAVFPDTSGINADSHCAAGRRRTEPRRNHVRPSADAAEMPSQCRSIMSANLSYGFRRCHFSCALQFSKNLRAQASLR